MKKKNKKVNSNSHNSTVDKNESQINKEPTESTNIPPNSSDQQTDFPVKQDMEILFFNRFISYGEKYPAFTAFLFTLFSTVVFAALRFSFFLFRLGYLSNYHLDASFVDIDNSINMYNIGLAIGVSILLLGIRKVYFFCWKHAKLGTLFVSIGIWFIVFICVLSMSNMFDSDLRKLVSITVVLVLHIIALFIMGFTTLTAKACDQMFNKSTKEITSSPHAPSLIMVVGTTVCVFFLCIFVWGLYAGREPRSFKMLNNDKILICEHDDYFICCPCNWDSTSSTMTIYNNQHEWIKKDSLEYTVIRFSHTEWKEK